MDTPSRQALCSPSTPVVEACPMRNCPAICACRPSEPMVSEKVGQRNSDRMTGRNAPHGQCRGKVIVMAHAENERPREREPSGPRNPWLPSGPRNPWLPEERGSNQQHGARPTGVRAAPCEYGPGEEERTRQERPLDVLNGRSASDVVPLSWVVAVPGVAIAIRRVLRAVRRVVSEPRALVRRVVAADPAARSVGHVGRA